jgi:LPXTG-motif cell wall-anchored protein
MIRKALAALLLSMLVLVGAAAVASAGDREESTCSKYSYSDSHCKPAYPPKPPKPKPHPPTPPKVTPPVASPPLAKTGADNQTMWLAIGGGLVVVGAAAYGASRLRRQN